MKSSISKLDLEIQYADYLRSFNQPNRARLIPAWKTPRAELESAYSDWLLALQMDQDEEEMKLLERLEEEYYHRWSLGLC